MLRAGVGAAAESVRGRYTKNPFLCSPGFRFRENVQDTEFALHVALQLHTINGLPDCSSPHGL